MYADPGTYHATFTAYDDDTSTADPVEVTVERRPTTLVPLMVEPTANDGDFEVTARLFDALNNQAPMIGFPIRFNYADGSIAAVTDSDSIARATIHFASHSNSSVQYSFAGDARYVPSSDQVDYLVRDGDIEPVEATSQPSSAEGYRFAIAFPEAANYQLQQNKRLVIMLSSRVNTTATVRAPGIGFETTVAVAPAQVTFVNLPDSLRMGSGTGALNDGDSGIIENKGVEITSLDEIGVQVLDQIKAAADGYLALPTDRLGNDYLALGMYNEKRTSFGASAGSQVAVLAVEDGTQVTIVPNSDVPAGPALPQGARRGESFTITLDALQTFQIVAGNTVPEVFEDLSGSHITSSKPVAVFAGHVCSSFGVGASACNHLIEQMPPINSFGTRFATVPFDFQPTGAGDQQRLGDAIRVLAAYDDTEVRVDDILRAQLGRGEIYQFRESLFGYHEIKTSHPSLVAQYVFGPEGLNFEIGDPSFTLVPAVDQFIDRFVVAPPDPMLATPLNPAGYVYRSHFSVIAKSSEVGAIRMDGAPLTSTWRAIGDGTYAGTRFPIAQSTHVLTSAVAGVKFMVLSYGFEFYDSYSMPGGMQLAIPQCRPSKTIAGDKIDNDCDGVEGEELLNGVDDDGDGVPDEDLSGAVSAGGANHAPVVYATSSPQLAAQDQSLTIFAPGYDEDGDALTYRLVSAPAGTTLSGNRITVPSGSPGDPRSVVVVANDGHVDSAPATLTATYFGTCGDPLRGGSCNEVPYLWGGNFDSQVIKVPSGQVVQWNGRFFAQDLDRQPVTFQLVTAPAGMTIDAHTGLISWVVDSSMMGTYSVTATGTDTAGAGVGKSITLTVVNDSTNTAPVFDSSPVLSVDAAEPYAYVLIAHDLESATSALSYRLIVGPTGMQLVGKNLTWTPTERDIGEHVALVNVTDPNGAVTPQRFSVTVLGSPLQFVSQPALTAAVGAEYVYKTELATTVARDGLAFSFIGPTTCAERGGCTTVGAVAGMRLNQETGELRWNPAASQLGDHEVVLVVRDTSGNVGR